MTLYKFFTVCDKTTRVLLIQDGKRVLTASRIGQETIPFLSYSVLGITHKNQQLRISIDSEKVRQNILTDDMRVYIKDIMPLVEDGENLAVSDAFFKDREKPINNIKLSPLDILVVT